MKLLLSIVTLFCSAIAFAQTPNDNNDSTLAKRLKANDMGMKQYVLVVLKTGANTSNEKTPRDAAFAGHMKNINKLADEGMLVLAGPLGKNENSFRGIFILNVDKIDDAKALVQTDPAVQEKYLDADYYPFFGTAALQEMTPIHRKIQKYK